MAFEICVNTGPYGAGNFKMLLLLQFSSDIKLYEDIGYYGGIQAVTFLGNRTSFKNFKNKFKDKFKKKILAL